MSKFLLAPVGARYKHAEFPSYEHVLIKTVTPATWADWFFNAKSLTVEETDTDDPPYYHTGTYVRNKETYTAATEIVLPTRYTASAPGYPAVLGMVTDDWGMGWFDPDSGSISPPIPPSTVDPFCMFQINEDKFQMCFPYGLDYDSIDINETAGSITFVHTVGYIVHTRILTILTRFES